MSDSSSSSSPLASWIHARIGSPSVLIAELLVTALGVFLGVGLDGCQQQRRADAEQQRYRTQVYRVLDQRLAEVRPDLDAAVTAFDSLRVQPFLDAYRTGAMPRPEPLYNYAPGVGASVWDAMIRAGDLDALDLSVVIAAQEFHDAEQDLRAVVRDVRRLSDAHLIPNAGAPRETFYDAGTGELRPTFAWYPRALFHLRRSVRSVKTRADSLQAVLHRHR